MKRITLALGVALAALVVAAPVAARPAAATATTVTYICTVVGHAAAGMKGRLSVT